MNDNNDIRRALADMGMEAPADRTVPAKLVADLHTHPGLDDGGAGIVEQAERFDEFTGAPTTDPANQYIVNIPLDEDHKAALLKQTNVSVSRIEVAPGWKCAPPPTTDPASRAIAAHTTPGKSSDIEPTDAELGAIIVAYSQGPQQLWLAVAKYGLRIYKAGADFTLGCMSGGGK